MLPEDQQDDLTCSHDFDPYRYMHGYLFMMTEGSLTVASRKNRYSRYLVIEMNHLSNRPTVESILNTSPR